MGEDTQSLLHGDPPHGIIANDDSCANGRTNDGRPADMRPPDIAPFTLEDCAIVGQNPARLAYICESLREQTEDAVAPAQGVILDSEPLRISSVVRERIRLFHDVKAELAPLAVY